MPRPCKRRRICAMPGCGRFGPKDGKGAKQQGDPVIMTVDEFETVRLIDLEGMNQEECAERMNVARTTAQAIYNSARTKLAECLVNRKELRIEGGDYELCDGSAGTAGCRNCCRRQEGIAASAAEAPRTDDMVRGRLFSRKGKNSMKIAVTYENGQIFQHFGHTEQFCIYEAENGKVTGRSLVDSDGCGHGALAEFLRQRGVDTLICGGIGGGAQQALAEAGIQVFGGASGDADSAVEALLAGNLVYDADVHCDHHEHEGGCGEHRCS